ncbi:MAG: hypothetical protein ACK5XY_02405, partial [Brevundimonas sp.]
MIPARRPGVLALIPGLIPGLIACVAVALVAVAVQALEVRLFGRGSPDAIVRSLPLGAAIRSVWTPPAAILRGIEFRARSRLEMAVVRL